jgi:cyclopropane fatty-acyl-phospholipid synthase-like methyltransferase
MTINNNHKDYPHLAKQKERGSHNYHEQYFEHIENGYYPFSFLRDKVVIHFVKKLIPKGQKILELGCGTGRFITQLKNNYETYGIDISAYAIDEAKRRNQSTVFLNRSLEQSDLFSIKFDAIVAINTLEHLSDSEMMLEKLHTNLRQNGFLFIHLPVASNKFSKFLLNRFYHDQTHVFIPSITRLNVMLNKIGFTTIHERSGTFIFLPIGSRSVLEMTPAYFGIYKKI